MVASFLFDIILLLVVAVMVVPFCQKIKLGAVPGFLLAGVIVGSHGLGLIHHYVEISQLAEIGVSLLMFVIGIELKPSRLWQMRRLVFGLGLLQVSLTGVLLTTAIYLYFDISLSAAILIGPTLALSSTAFVLQLLAEQKLLTSTYGRTSFAILLFQDLAVVPLLTLVPLLAMPELTIGKDVALTLLKSLLILGLVITLGRFFLHPILHRVALAGNGEVFTASALLIVLGSALITEHIGFSMAMGAFLAGLLISDSSYRHQVMAEIQPFRGLLLGLFFISMGMALNLNLLLDKPGLSLGLTAILIAIKAVILFPFTHWFGIKRRHGIAVSLVLAQSGEFALVLFSLAFQSEILSEQIFQQLLLVVLLSMLATPLLSAVAYRQVKHKPPRKNNLKIPIHEAPIVLVGFGRVGRRIGEMLTTVGKPFVALDANPSTVEKERANGHPVFYGDATQPELLKAAGASHAEVIIVSLNEREATEEIVASLLAAYPKKHIFVRGQSLTHCCNLRSLGATAVVSENVEVSLELTNLALTSIGVDRKKRDAIINDFRSTYHRQIKNAEYRDRQ